MARKSTPKTSVAPEPVPPVVENIPSVHGRISALASADAPYVFFEQVPFFGLHDGVAMVTLTAQRHLGVLPDGSIAIDHVITGLLRGSIPAMRSLRSAIDGILLLAEPRPQSPN